MTLWILFALLLLAALAFVAFPLYRNSKRLSLPLGGAILGMVALSAGLYSFIGNPDARSGPGTSPDIGAMVTSLASRLQENPDDVNGWRMLGRSYQTLGQFEQSIAAFEKAIELEDSRNSQTLVSLALVLLEVQNGGPSDRATGLLENALALAPNDPNALFYSGFAAASRGDTELAADRWEILLGLNAPPEIRQLLQEKINEWRGIAAPAVANVDAPAGAIVVVNLSVSDEARVALPADAVVFVIARDPQRPSPPIAVTRRRLSELPLTVSLTDRDSMVPGRTLSAFPQFELLARVSVSGQPLAQSGDWFGSLIHDASGDNTVDLIIDRQVP